MASKVRQVHEFELVRTSIPVAIISSLELDTVLGPDHRPIIELHCLVSISHALSLGLDAQNLRRIAPLARPELEQPSMTH